MARSTPTSRKGSLIETGVSIAQTFIKQPMKEAVREALAEERAESKSQPTRDSDTSSSVATDSSSGGSGSSTMRRLLLLAAFAGVAYFAMRKRGVDIEEGLSQEFGTGEMGGATESSIDDPLTSEHETSEGEASGSETDDGPTNRS